MAAKKSMLHCTYQSIKSIREDISFSVRKNEDEIFLNLHFKYTIKSKHNWSKIYYTPDWTIMDIKARLTIFDRFFVLFSPLIFVFDSATKEYIQTLSDHLQLIQTAGGWCRFPRFLQSPYYLELCNQKLVFIGLIYTSNFRSILSV